MNNSLAHRYITPAILACFIMISEANAQCEDPAGFEARRQALEATRNGGGFYSGPDADLLPVYTVKPEYPGSAKLGKPEGWVQVHFNVDPEGNVKDAIVVGSSHPEIFDEAALAAISQYRYKPKIQGSVAVERKDMDTIIRLCPEG